MVMAGVIQVADLHPAVLRHIVRLTFLGGLIWVLRTDSIDVILGLIVELAVQVRQLMAGAGILHRRPLVDFIGLLINDEGII